MTKHNIFGRLVALTAVCSAGLLKGLNTAYFTLRAAAAAPASRGPGAEKSIDQTIVGYKGHKPQAQRDRRYNDYMH